MFSTHLKQQVKEAEAEFQQERDEIKQLSEELRDLRTGASDRDRSEREIAERQVKLQVEMQLMRKRFMRSEANAYSMIYDDIVDAVARFAKEHDIAVVYRKEAGADRKASGTSASAALRKVGEEANPLKNLRLYATATRAPMAAYNAFDASPDEADDASSVMRRISRSVVYERDERWDITEDILDMLDRKRTEPKERRGKKGFYHRD